jgi:hypothetical protein
MEFLVHTEWPMWFGYAAVAASIVTCAMKTMIPLRFVSMICNALFVIYGFIGGVYVLVFALHTTWGRILVRTRCNDAGLG